MQANNPEHDNGEEELSEEQSKLTIFNIFLLVVGVILKLGNEVLRNVGVEDEINDVSVFFRYFPIDLKLQ